jgi:hypothetical protein
MAMGRLRRSRTMCPSMTAMGILVEVAIGSPWTKPAGRLCSSLLLASVQLRRQCHVRFPPALAGFISTLRVKVRCSSGRMAPTPTNLRAISSPRSLRMVSTMEYSHAPLSAGLRKLPSTRSGVDADTAVVLVGSLKRSLWRQAGHTAALSRMVSRQCGQVRVAPAVPGGVVLTTKRSRCAHGFCARCRPCSRPSRTRPGRACANPLPR